jgi:hypothetical protein
MKIAEILTAVLLISLIALQSGCRTSVAENPQISEIRGKFVLPEEPSGAVGVADAKELLKEQSEIVVVGRIGAGDHRPWDDGRASFIMGDAAAFMLADSESDEHSHPHGAPGHDPDKCPFCSRAKSLDRSLAIVKFLDDHGAVLAIDARKLLGVRENQIVVVRGHGAVDALGNLSIAAQGIYIRE